MHNPADILYGRLPRFRLSDFGIQQAETASRFLASRRLAAIYSSPLLRARQTAQIISQYHPGVAVLLRRDLLEVRTAYQGEPNSILKKGFSFYEPRKDPGDESMGDIFERLLRFLRSVARKHAGRSVVAVSHADPVAIMRVGLQMLPLTPENLHTTVYPMRASINQITLSPHAPIALAYFNAAGDQA